MPKRYGFALTEPGNVVLLIHDVDDTHNPTIARKRERDESSMKANGPSGEMNCKQTMSFTQELYKIERDGTPFFIRLDLITRALMHVSTPKKRVTHSQKQEKKNTKHLFWSSSSSFSFLLLLLLILHHMKTSFFFFFFFKDYNICVHFS